MLEPSRRVFSLQSLLPVILYIRHSFAGYVRTETHGPRIDGLLDILIVVQNLPTHDGC